MPDGVLLQCLAEPPLLQVFLIFMWAYNTTPLVKMSSHFSYKPPVGVKKTVSEFCGVPFESLLLIPAGGFEPIISQNGHIGHSDGAAEVYVRP